MNEAKDGKAKLRSDMGEIKRVQKKKTFQEARINVENIDNARKVATDFLNEFTSRASEARHQAKKGTGLKILTLKQMLPTLSIALA